MTGSLKHLVKFDVSRVYRTTGSWGSSVTCLTRSMTLTVKLIEQSFELFFSNVINAAPAP